MKNVVIFLVLIVLVVCPFPNAERYREDRQRRRKEYEKQIIECIVGNEKVSQQLKNQLEENKHNDVREILREHFNKYDDSDREVIRKCRREYFNKMKLMRRDILRERFNRNFTHHHFPEEYNGPRHSNGSEHFRHHFDENEHHLNISHRFPFHSRPLHSGEYLNTAINKQFPHPSHSGEYPHPFGSGAHPNRSHLPPFGSRSPHLSSLRPSTSASKSNHTSSSKASSSANKPSASNNALTSATSSANKQ